MHSPVTRKQKTSHMQKPLVMATATALMTLVAGQAYAVCPSAISSPLTTTQNVSSTCEFVVTEAGSVIISSGSNAITVNTSNENDTSISNAGTIKSNTNAINITDSSFNTNISNTGMLAGGNYAVTRSHDNQDVRIYNSDGGHIIGSITGTNISNYSGSTITLKTGITDFSTDGIRNTGEAGHATLSGEFWQESGATLRIAIVSTSGENPYSYLSAADGAFIDGGTLDVDVKANSGITAGDKFHIIRTNNINGAFEHITDNSAMFNFTQANSCGESCSSNGLFITAIRTLTAEQAARNNGNNPGIGAGKVLDSGAPGLQSVLDALGQLETEQEVSNAVSQTLPLQPGAASGATQNALSSINRVVQARIEGQHGLSAGDEAHSDQYLWVKPFGSWARQNAQDGVAGYDANTYGITLGADKAIAANLRLGAALAYAKIDINGNASAAPQSSDVDVYQLIGYGSYKLDDRTSLNFQADIGQGRNKGRRDIALTSSVASSSYDSLSAHAGLGLGRNYSLNDSTDFTPSVRADYTWIKDEAYQETGAGVLNLNVQSHKTDALVLAVDGKLTKQLPNNTELLANIGVGYDALNERSSITAAFAGAADAAFVTYGSKPSPWLARAGMGLTHKTGSGMEITGRYDAEYRTGFLNQTASVKLRWLF